MEYRLHEISTKDGLVHQGIYHEPKKKGDIAVLWIHGLTGNFYGDAMLLEHIIAEADPAGIGFAAFNTRGHDMIAGLRRVDGKSPTGYAHAAGGTGREVFTDCVLDIDAGISFLIKQGFSKVILVGHSTGANKACYYAGTKRNAGLGGVVLAGPLSDRLSEEKGNPKLPQNLRRMRHMVEKGKGDFLVNNLTFFPCTPERYISLFAEGSAEDVFDYGETYPTMKTYSKIRKPLLVVLSGNDEYADRPAVEIKNVFDAYAKSASYQSVIIPDATHGYDGKEDVFARTLVRWVKEL